MRRIISCQFNIDTACVDVKYEDGFVLSISSIRPPSKTRSRTPCSRVPNWIGSSTTTRWRMSDWL